MSEQDNIRSVQRGYEAFGRGDLDALLALFDQDIVWTTPGEGQLPTAGERRGRAAVADFFRLLGETFDITDFEPREYLAKGDLVVVIGRDREGPKGKGNLVDFDWIHVFEFRNGLVTRFREYADSLPIVTACREAGALAG